jgi:hypothetical protein
MTDQSIRQASRIVDSSAMLPWLLATAIYVLLLVLGSRLLADPDTYWQIALGDWIVAHREVPQFDTFSATLAGTPWISSQWLAQVLFAQTYALAGWAGVYADEIAVVHIRTGPAPKDAEELR